MESKDVSSSQVPHGVEENAAANNDANDLMAPPQQESLFDEPMLLNGTGNEQSSKPAAVEVPVHDLLDFGGMGTGGGGDNLVSNSQQNQASSAANGDVDFLFMGSSESHDQTNNSNNDNMTFQSNDAELLPGFATADTNIGGQPPPSATTDVSPFGDLLSLGTSDDNNNNNNAATTGDGGNLLDMTQPPGADPFLAQPQDAVLAPSSAPADNLLLVAGIGEDAATSSGGETGVVTEEQTFRSDLLSLGHDAESKEEPIGDHSLEKSSDDNILLIDDEAAVPDLGSKPDAFEPRPPENQDSPADDPAAGGEANLLDSHAEAQLNTESTAPVEEQPKLNLEQGPPPSTEPLSDNLNLPAPKSEDEVKQNVIADGSGTAEVPVTGPSTSTASPSPNAATPSDTEVQATTLNATEVSNNSASASSSSNAALHTGSSTLEGASPISCEGDKVNVKVEADGTDAMQDPISSPSTSVSEPSASNSAVDSSPPSSGTTSRQNATATQDAVDGSRIPEPDESKSVPQQSEGPPKMVAASTDNGTPSTPDPSSRVRKVPDTPLPQRVKWLEQELHAAHTLIMELQQQQGEEEEASGEAKRKANAVMVDLQANLQSQMSLRAEAEDAVRLAKAKADKMEKDRKTTKEETETKLKELNKNLMAALEGKAALETELKTLKAERDDQARKEAALVNRLNAAKKKEAAKANAAEHYEEQVESLQNQCSQLQGDLSAATEEKKQVQEQLTQLKESSERRIQQLESMLNEERRLNEERKRKMKGFVEAKAEEIRSSKETHVSLQTELDQTNRSLMELNQRWKQLHAQWVQAQTRNRELQRDMNKMQKDSEKMHKAGGTLEMKLSRSALETEEHKNKRLTAKNELMAVLRQLEAERDLTNRLRDSIKFTFTPKAISQQQIIQETLGEFENELQRLAKRLGRPLAPPAESMIDTVGEPSESSDNLDNPDNVDLNPDPARPSLAEANTQRLMSRLESETQRVSQCIMSFSASVERMHSLLSGPGTRNCVSVLQDLLTASGRNGHDPSNEETAAMTSGGRRSAGGTRYGQVPRAIA